MKILKKIGSILLCLLPFLLAFVIQLAVTFAAIFLKLMFAVMKDPSLLERSSISSLLFQLTNDSQFLAAVSAIYAILAAIAMGFWYYKQFVPKKRPRRQILNSTMLIGLLFMVISMQYIANYLVMAVSAVHPAWYDTYQELMNGIGFGNVTWVLALYSVLIAPISEELIFRGVTLRYAEKAMPFVLANILQALLFGLFHANVIQGVYAFVVGLFCGYVCLKGGSIYLSILFHMLFNLWGTFAPDFVFYAGDSFLIHSGVFAAAACGALIGILLYQKGVRNLSET